MYKHGGDVYGNKVELDFSINVNPLGMPKEVMEAACLGVRESGIYPDYHCRKLRTALAKKLCCREETLIFGNGAAEVLFLLCQVRKPKRALVLAPTFAEYEQALSAVGCNVEHFTLQEQEGFAVTDSLLTELEKGYDMFFLCNPNNPTGEAIDAAMLIKIMACCKENKTMLVVDECFQEFLEEEEQASLLPFVEEDENLCIVKAFTKIYCMAGLRLGYLVTSNQEIIHGIPRISQPWRVSIPAQYAGVAALTVTEYLEETKSVIRKERDYLREGLRLAGAKVYASKANYIFFQYETGLYEFLMERGILIRSCENYVGLNDCFYRVGIRLREDNEQLIEAMMEYKKRRGK